jgi:hypothetical protein
MLRLRLQETPYRHPLPKGLRHCFENPIASRTFASRARLTPSRLAGTTIAAWLADQPPEKPAEAAEPANCADKMRMTDTGQTSDPNAGPASEASAAPARLASPAPQLRLNRTARVAAE